MLAQSRSPLTVHLILIPETSEPPRRRWVLDAAQFNVYIHVWSNAMATNLAIDERLIEEARKLGRHRTKKDTVNAALDEYIQRRKQQEILSLFGTIEYDPTYDYKRERRGKRT